MHEQPRVGPESIGSEPEARAGASMLGSADSFTAEITRRRLRGRLFGDAGGSLEVGPFELRERIGAGAMGTVYAAWDRRLERQVALKFLLHRRDGDEELRVREAQALASLSHPNVVSVFDVGTYEGRVWLAMEFIEGSTVRAWIEERPRSASEILSCWTAVGRGLAAVHALNLVHRDVKPDNVLVDRQGRAILVDFGLVCVAQAPASTIPSGDAEGSGPTSGANFAGTRAYAAPEQRAGESVDARADQYAFCVCVWESLLGARPERDERGALRPGVGAGLPRRVRRALARGLALSPEHRFPSMDALLDALAPASGRRFIALGFVVTATLGTAIGFALVPRASEPRPCVGAAASIDELYPASRRERVERTSPELAREFESWAEQWRRHVRQNCEARAQEVVSTDLADRRQACLDRRLLEFEAALDWVSVPPRLGSEFAPILVDPATCLSAPLPGASVPPPELAEEIARLRRELDRLVRDGGFPSATALARIDALAIEAEALGWPRLIGEVALVAADIHRFAGDTTRARLKLGQAVDIARASDDDELAFEAWHGMVRLEIDMALDPEAARWAWERMRTAAEAIGAQPIHRGTLAFAAGNIARLAGSPQTAEAELRQALVHFDDAGVSGRYRQVQVLDVLAASLALEGRGEESQRLIARSEELRAALGRAADHGLQREGDHAFTTGLGHYAAGDLDAARTELEAALASYDRGVGGGQRVAQVLVALAAVEDAAGRRDVARQHAELADAVCVAELSPMHPIRASTQSAIGTLALRDGRVDAAVEAFNRVLDIELAGTRTGPGGEREEGTDHALARSNLAEALVAAGRVDEARTHAERALATLTRALPDDHLDLAYAHKAVGLVLLAEARVDEAAERFERAIDLHTTAGESGPELDELHILLARAREPGAQP